MLPTPKIPHYQPDRVCVSLSAITLGILCISKNIGLVGADPRVRPTYLYKNPLCPLLLCEASRALGGTLFKLFSDFFSHNINANFARFMLRYRQRFIVFHISQECLVNPYTIGFANLGD
jgi:hypothetical protein